MAFQIVKPEFFLLAKNSSYQVGNLCILGVLISGIQGLVMYNYLRFSPYFPQNRFRVHFPWISAPGKKPRVTLQHRDLIHGIGGWINNWVKKKRFYGEDINKYKKMTFLSF